jgi:hypothetical protein
LSRDNGGPNIRADQVDTPTDRGADSVSDALPCTDASSNAVGNRAPNGVPLSSPNDCRADPTNATAVPCADPIFDNV